MICGIPTSQLILVLIIFTSPMLLFLLATLFRLWFVVRKLSMGEHQRGVLNDFIRIVLRVRIILLCKEWDFAM